MSNPTRAKTLLRGGSGTYFINPLRRTTARTPEKVASHSASNCRAEYAALRAEVLYADQVCLMITGALLSGSIAVLSFIMQGGQAADLAALLAPVWLIGYLYITEKRFVIETIARYVRHRVESNPGFGWEKWLSQQDHARDRFPRAFPYVIESIVSFGATVLILLFIGWQNGWKHTWGMLISVLSIALLAISGGRSIPRYLKRHKPNGSTTGVRLSFCPMAQLAISERKSIPRYLRRDKVF